MPTTVSSIFIFVALLMPGFVYRSALRSLVDAGRRFPLSPAGVQHSSGTRTASSILAFGFATERTYTADCWSSTRRSRRATTEASS